MTSKRFIASLAVVGSTIVLSPGQANGSQPADVTIMTTQVCPSAVASFVATGAIDDSGTVTATILSPEAGPFGITGNTLHGEVVFTGTKGSFTLIQHVSFKTTEDPDIFAEPGSWVLVAGTGAYADLEGQGRSSGTCDFGAAIEIQTFAGRVR